MRKIECDRCKKIIDSGYEFELPEKDQRLNFKKKFDLCGVCKEDLRQWVWKETK